MSNVATIVIPSILSTAPSRLNADEFAFLDSDQFVALQIAVANFRRSREAEANAFFNTAVAIHSLFEILGERLITFAQKELKLNRQYVNRYLKGYKMLRAHFSEQDGRIAAEVAKSFTQSALLLLEDDTTEEVIVELKQIVNDGGTVNEATVQQLLNRQAENYKAQVSITEAELEKAKSESMRDKAASELNMGRLEGQLRGKDEAIRRLEAQKMALEEDLATLQKNSMQVQEKPVPTVPEKYRTIEEAIASISAKKKEVAKELEIATSELEKIKAQQTAIRESFQLAQTSIEQLAKFKEEIDDACARLSTVGLKQLLAADTSAARYIEETAALIIAKGEQLRAVAIL